MIAASRVPLRLFLLAFALALVDVPARAQPAAEYRAFWVDTFNTRLNTATDVTAVVTRARAARANLLIVQARRRGDSWYLDSLEPPPDGVAFDRGFDPLHEVIAQAHAAGLQVHAGVVVADIWNQTTLPTSPAHVFNHHGLTPAGTAFSGRAGWLTRTLVPDGQATSYGGHRFGTDFWIDPGHPDAVAYSIDVLMRLVSSYDIDGLHLDRLQYPDYANPGQGASVGYNETSLERFRRRHRLPVDLVPEAGDPSWAAWRREQLTALQRRLYLSVTAVKPTLVLSVAAFAGGEAPRSDDEWPGAEPASRVFQDWRAWMEEGIVDLVVPTTYLPEHTASGASSFEAWLAWTRQHLYGRHAAMAIGAYLNSVEGSLRQARQALGATTPEQAASGDRAGRGVVFFSMGAHNAPVSQNPLAPTPRDTPYRSFEDLATGLTTGRTGTGQALETVTSPALFASELPVPVMPWKAAPTTGALKGVILGPGGSVLDGAEVTIEGSGSGTAGTRTDGGGFYGRTGLVPGDYRVLIVPDGDGQYRSVCTVTIVSGRVATLDLRIDPATPVTAACH